MSTQYQVKAAIDRIEAFEVVGVSVVTRKDKAAEDINALWERFFSEKVGQAVAGKVNDVIYAVYSGYEGDYTQPYRLTIGYAVRGDVAVPAGLDKIAVEAAPYAILSAAGEQPRALIETWKSVWESDLDRMYVTDFEMYGPRFFEPGLHEILLHVGIKEGAS